MPKEKTPPRAMPGAHWATPEKQVATGPVLKRADLKEPTPVFSTAVPPRGVSGTIRRIAYTIPDHRAKHWMLLMAADRVDVIGNNLGGFLLGRVVPAAALAVAVGALIGTIRRPRRRFRWI